MELIYKKCTFLLKKDVFFYGYILIRLLFFIKNVIVRYKTKKMKELTTKLAKMGSFSTLLDKIGVNLPFVIQTAFYILNLVLFAKKNKTCHAILQMFCNKS